MSTERRARRWLRLDALYCVGAGLLAVALAEPLARLFHVPAEVAVALGAAAVVWGLALARFATSARWHASLRLVATANAAASATLMGLAIVAPSMVANLVLAAVAVEVAAFASIQLRILRQAA